MREICDGYRDGYSRVRVWLMANICEHIWLLYGQCMVDMVICLTNLGLFGVG